MIEPIWKSYIVKTTEPVLTPQQCDEFIRVGQSEPRLRGITGGAAGAMRSEKLDQELRKSTISWIPSAKAPALYKPIHEWIVRINNNTFGFDPVQLIEAGQYAEYSKGDFYDWHMDTPINMSAMPPVRKISMTLLLSDPKDYEGGYLQIFGDNFFKSEKSKIKIERGYAVFFASFLLHRVTPVTKGNRKSLVMWFGGEPLK